MKKYYPVVYLHNGDMCVGSACATEEECIEALKKAICKHPDKIKATTYMFREDGGEFLFGHPSSRDILKNKKIMKELSL